MQEAGDQSGSSRQSSPTATTKAEALTNVNQVEHQISRISNDLTNIVTNLHHHTHQIAKGTESHVELAKMSAEELMAVVVEREKEQELFLASVKKLQEELKVLEVLRGVVGELGVGLRVLEEKVGRLTR